MNPISQCLVALILLLYVGALTSTWRDTVSGPPFYVSTDGRRSQDFDIVLFHNHNEIILLIYARCSFTALIINTKETHLIEYSDSDSWLDRW